MRLAALRSIMGHLRIWPLALLTLTGACSNGSLHPMTDAGAGNDVGAGGGGGGAAGSAGSPGTAGAGGGAGAAGRGGSGGTGGMPSRGGPDAAPPDATT